MEVDKVNALILAGGKNKKEFGADIDNKAFIEMNNKWIVEYVAEALRDSDAVDRISIVGPAKRLKSRLTGKADYFIEEEADLFDNIKKGLEPFKDNGFVLIVTSDIPMISGTIVSELIKSCKALDADLCYPIVERKVNERMYPGFKRTYVKLRDGIFTGGNIIGLNPDVIEPCAEFAKEVISRRKNPWRMGRLLGINFLAWLVMGMLRVTHIEKRFFKLLKIKAKALIVPYPEIANDIDKPSDVELTRLYIK
ncbi:MAG: NTP transferase domain-containing protein [Clostridiales bacterium]|nr:NTP transferase domain-containing protein [Clostridiales bacterium]